MKNLLKDYIILGMGLFVGLIGCKKDSNPVTPPSYVDTYTVHLIDAQGTMYTGNYFPLNVGDVSNFSGEQITTTVIPGYTEANPAPQTTAIMGMFEVLPKHLIQLSSGQDSLYPVIDWTTAGPDTSRFFMKDTTAVYIKAFKMPDRSYYEVVNPMFIKSKLVVGDSWEAAPQIDMAKMLASQVGQAEMQSNLIMNTRAKFFVVGGEIVSLNSGPRFSVRLEQANSISMSGTVMVENVMYNLNMTGQFATVYHLIADTGIVQQNLTGSMSIKLGSGAQSMTITINISKCELTLTSRSSGVQGNYLSVHKSSVGQAISFTTKTEEKEWKISQAIMKVIMRELSL